MKKTYKKLMSIILSFIILYSFSTVTYANSNISYSNDIQLITKESEYYLTPNEILTGDYFSDQQIELSIANGEEIIGGINIPISEITNENSTRDIYSGEVWYRSYATYSETNGISVYIELYVPWYYFTNPKFTRMSGNVVTSLNGSNSIKYFYQSEDESSTIDSTVETERTASSGTVGTITISGTAAGTNIANGIGTFTTSYSVTIP